MRKTAVFIILIMIMGCSTQKKSDTPSSKNGSNNIVQSDVKEGWLDNDTYTVHVSAENLETAIDRAQYQILKDIVEVRMINNSRYTDIKKIQVEFEKPLKNGTVIKSINTSQGIEIWFQIKDRGLKEKFRRQ